MKPSGKVLLALVFFVAPFAVIAQSESGKYVISWGRKSTLIIEGKYKEIVSFENADHLPENNFLPSFPVLVEDVYSSEVYIDNIVWSPLTEDDIKSLPSDISVPSEPKYIVYNPVERKRVFTEIQIVPFRKNSSGILEKVLSFEVKLNPQSPPLSNHSTSQQRVSSASNSVLSTGEWYKVPFPATGIYKIDYKYLISLGINPAAVNPYNIQIWGNGGGMLPESNISPRKTDLNQISVFVSENNNNNQFDENEYILFYVHGPDVWQFQEGGNYYKFHKNIYSKYSFYFLTIASGVSNQIERQGFVEGEAESVFNTTVSRYHHEVDNINFLSSGRRWYGEEISNNASQTFSVSTNGIIPGKQIHVLSSLMNKSGESLNPSNFNVSINNTLVKSYTLYGGGSNTYDKIGSEGDFYNTISSDFIGGQQILNYSVRYSRSRGTGTGYLNYFTLSFEEELAYNSKNLDFRHPGSIGKQIIGFNIRNANTQIRIWDVTNLHSVLEPAVETANGTTSFKYTGDSTLHEFIAFSGDDFNNPLPGFRINNQNIRALETPDYLIITHPDFKQQANKLAEFRKQHNNMQVEVVTTEEVFNEFSSGSQDLVALRDLARMFSKRPDGDRFKYVLLMGDASFDYKNLKNISQPQSFVPIYQSEESLNPTQSYSSDDYIGLLSDNEGRWLSYQNDRMDIGVGRIPVRTPEEAEAVVHKIIHYETSPAALGAWRQNLTFIADNEDKNIFLFNAEELVVSSPFLMKNYNSKKVYIAAYPKNYVLAAPDANKVVEQEFERGSFIMNYIGHGSEKQLASENVINTGTITNLKNMDKLTFMVTATCDFGKYDDPVITSGGELFVLNPNGGAIGVLGTTRPVFQDYNRKINAQFYKYVFSKVNGRYLRLGDIIRESKNYSLSGIYNRNFALLGDPALTLAYPQNSVEITALNGKPFDYSKDTLKAQSKVTISGAIKREGLLMSDFNGVVDIQIYDKPLKVETVDLPKTSFNVNENKIFDGSATVRNGEFTFTFIVPRNINYIVGKGRMLFYANHEDGKIVDAFGGDTVLIGGGENNMLRDNTPPEIKVYLNDESFIQGGITNENPVLIVKLYDENGINSFGTGGGSITAVLNNRNDKEIILDGYYKADRDTYKSGTIRFKLSEGLSEGYNTVRVKAFDSNANSRDASAEFNVARKENLTLKNILNYPNPFTTNTVFHFDHNRSGDDLEILLQVFTVTGKLIKTFSQYHPAAPTHISDIIWDGKDEFGDNIGRGVYVYKLSVKALSDGYKKEEFQKLVVLN